MLKRVSSSFFITIILLGTACSSNQAEPNETSEVIDHTQQTEIVQVEETEPEELVPTSTATTEPTTTAMASATPIPPTETPLPTSTPTPTLTPTPRPITHANIGWAGYDTEVRDSFPDEMRIKNEIVENNQNNQMLSGITVEDIRTIWYVADDGTLFWRTYFTINNEQVNNDLYLYVYSLTTDPDGSLSFIPFPKLLNISALERLGYVQNLTDIQLLWNERTNAPALAIEKNGLRFWYPDELEQNLVSYDQNLSALGLPEMPVATEEFVTVLFAPYPQDVYLFAYDEKAAAFAEIGKPNEGPVYKLVNTQWQAVNHPEFIGGGSPQVAYIGYDADGNGNLYIEETTNYQTDIQVISNVHTPLAPAAVLYSEDISNMNSFDYYYSIASPVWSPDGHHVAFLAEENDSPFLAVYDLESETWQSLAQLSGNIEQFIGPIWSPESNWLVYGYSNPGGLPRLITVSYPDGVAYEIDQGWQANWVQDVNGLRLIYRKSQEELFSVNPDGSSIEVIPVAYKRPDGNNERILEYLPENKAFLIYRYDEEDGMAKLLQVPIDGGEENLLVQFPEQYETYSLLIPTWTYSAISPDGTWFWCLATSPDGQSGVYILNLETQESRINKSAWFITGWTPDSKGIIQSGVSVHDIVTDGLVYHSQITEALHMTNTWQNTNVLKWPDTP